MGQPLLHESCTERILGVFYEVHWELGSGFLESVYAAAMAQALTAGGLQVEREVPIAVHFRGRRVGTFRADQVIDSAVLLEIKAGDRLDPNWEAQLLNYLRSTPFEVGLMLHFGPKPVFKRRIFTNDRKQLASRDRRRIDPVGEFGGVP